MVLYWWYCVCVAATKPPTPGLSHVLGKYLPTHNSQCTTGMISQGFQSKKLNFYIPLPPSPTWGTKPYHTLHANNFPKHLSCGATPLRRCLFWFYHTLRKIQTTNCIPCLEFSWASFIWSSLVRSSERNFERSATTAFSSWLLSTSWQEWSWCVCVGGWGGGHLLRLTHQPLWSVVSRPATTEWQMLHGWKL